MHYQQPYELRNIKKTPDNTYQIQFIRNGKSYSEYAYSLKKAKPQRDKMEQQLGMVNQEFHDKPFEDKNSLVPGTDKPMPAGISQHYSEQRNQYHISVSFYDVDKKPRMKHFYAGTLNTFDDKSAEAYERAVEFRESWEDAVICDELGAFDPRSFNLERV